MVHDISRRRLVGAAIAGGALAGWPGRAAAPRGTATLIHDVRLVDGTGTPARPADVLIVGDRIARVGTPGRVPAGRGVRTIVGAGRVLAPGFIDLHTHGDPLSDSYDGFLAMGVTTILVGQDGSGPRLPGDPHLAPWLAAAARAPLDVNVAALASHGTLRRAAGISDADRRIDAAQTARMTALLDAELGAGAFGLSYGLEYVPGIYAETAELTALGRVVARRGGVAMSHMRSENDEEVEAAIDELVASSAPARAHISHLKIVFGKGADRGRRLLDYITAKRRQGVALTADAYPFTAGYTGVAILFPQWALPPTDYARVVATRRAELRDYLEKRMIRRGGPEALLLGTAPYAGRTVAQAAQAEGLHFADFLVKLGPQGGSGAHFTMDQATQDTLFAAPDVAVATDGGPGMRHPRATSTYAKLIADYVVRDRTLSIEAAIHKATGLPATILRLPDRGVIRPGAVADLVLFDPSAVRARSSYLDPFAHASGFDLVMTNGEVAFADGARVARRGRLLRAS